jgi:predicted ATPase
VRGHQPELPVPPSSFIGRREQIKAIRALLTEARLTNLTGPPGVGKTRLALEVGGRVQPDFPDGVWLIESRPLTDPQGLVDAVTGTLDLPQIGPDKPRAATDAPLGPLASLVDHLHSRHALLILDSCEHLVAGAAALLQPLLISCPELRILATSREALGAPGEARRPVPALTVPDAAADQDPDEVRSFEAVRLFEDRAGKVQPSFALTPESSAAVAEVCRRVDGLPLAIELAAARVKVLSVGRIADALDDRFHLLIAGARIALPRQQTLRATIDWSYDLLNQDERDLFEHLSVFPAGCSLETAQAVGEQLGLSSFRVLHLIAGLADKSLLISGVGTGGEPRYRMLESLRAYGADQLREHGQLDLAGRRHAELFVTLAEDGERGLRGPDQLRWRGILGAELDNFRAALDTMLMQRDSAGAVRLAGALGLFFSMTGRHTEGRRILEAALSIADNAVPAAHQERAVSYLGSLHAQ